MADLLTIDEAAAYFRVRSETIKRLRSKGDLPFRKVGRVWMVERADLDAYLDRPPKARPSLPPRCTLYRFYDASGALLYVGITGAGATRWHQHSKAQPWWTEVATVRLEHLDSLDALLTAEIESIRAERPKYNVRGQPR